MRGMKFKENNDSVQVSFKYSSHTNLAVSGTASTTPALNTTEVLISLTVAAHVKIGGTATTSDFVLPAGLWPILITKGTTVSVIQLSGGNAGQASVITPEV